MSLVARDGALFGIVRGNALHASIPNSLWIIICFCYIEITFNHNMGHEVGLCLQRSWKPAPHWFVNRQRQKLELQPPTDCRCEQFVAASDCSAEAR